MEAIYHTVLSYPLHKSVVNEDGVDHLSVAGLNHCITARCKTSCTSGLYASPVPTEDDRRN